MDPMTTPPSQTNTKPDHQTVHLQRLEAMIRSLIMEISDLKIRTTTLESEMRSKLSERV